MRTDFAIFILSHGRPDNVVTAKMLEDINYTGAWYIVIDNEDDTEQQYRDLYGDKVIQFDKKAIAQTFDQGDTQEERRTVVYARNACFQIAKDLGLKYFMELDDDYVSMPYRKAINGKLTEHVYVKQADRLFEAMIEFLQDSGAVTVAMAQGGDFIGGVNGGIYKKRLSRKAMNTFVCTTDRPFQFLGRINEDVNTYTCLGARGDLFFTFADTMIHQCTTQQNKGGMTDVYLDSGTYLKSFYSVMYCPSAVKIAVMGNRYKRVHHNVNWEHCVPKIINERYKKGNRKRLNITF